MNPVETASTGTETTNTLGSGQIINANGASSVTYDLSMLMDSHEAAEEWQDRLKHLPKCHKDDDDCPTEASVEEALTVAKDLGLAWSSPVKTKHATLPLCKYLYNHLVIQCAHFQAGEAVTMIRDLAIKVGIPVNDGNSVRKQQFDVWPPMYWEDERQTFWLEGADGTWHCLAYEAIKAHLKDLGASDIGQRGGLSAIDTELVRVRHHERVRWVGPLAGQPTGLLKLAGFQILVPSSFKLIQPVPGDWEPIKSMIGQLLGEEQLPYFKAELKLGAEAYRDGSNQPGHMMIFCGPVDSMKSYIQHHVITPLWGGRSADARRYLADRTDFNSDLAAAEHCYLDDAKPYGDWMSRHDFAEALKGFIVNRQMSVHRKQKEAITLPSWTRITMSINDDEVALRSMPDITASLSDKIHLFKAYSVNLAMPNRTHAERRAFDAAVQAALPGFLAELYAWEIPAELLGGRFGVKHYHNQRLLEELDALSDESKLMELIDVSSLVCSSEPDWKDLPVWIGKAEVLHQELCSDRSTRFAAERLLGWRNATGTLLGKLAKKRPERVAYWFHRRGGEPVREWVIRLSQPDPAPDHARSRRRNTGGDLEN
jgi:hypothetical protein